MSCASLASQGQSEYWLACRNTEEGSHFGSVALTDFIVVNSRFWKLCYLKDIISLERSWLFCYGRSAFSADMYMYIYMCVYIYIYIKHTLLYEANMSSPFHWNFPQSLKILLAVSLEKNPKNMVNLKRNSLLYCSE